MGDTGLLPGANCLRNKTLAATERDTHLGNNQVRGISSDGADLCFCLGAGEVQDFYCAFGGWRIWCTGTFAFNL